MALTQVQPGMLGTPQPYAFKNRIINGAMAVSQYNGTSSTTVASNVASYVIDRWGFYSNGATQTIQQVSASAGGYQYGVQVTGATSATAATFYTRLESKNVWDLASKSITLSFVVYNSESSKTLTVLMDSANSSDNFSAVTNFSSTALTIPNGWSTQTITATASANVINGLQVQLQFGAVANGATRILTGVQLEKGVTATDFDYRAYGNELLLCQRYYEQINYVTSAEGIAIGYCQQTNVARYSVPIVVKRTAPLVAYTGTLAVEYGTGQVSNVSSLTDVRYGSGSTVSFYTVCGSVLTVGQAACLYANGTAVSLTFNSEL